MSTAGQRRCVAADSVAGFCAQQAILLSPAVAALLRCCRSNLAEKCASRSPVSELRLVLPGQLIQFFRHKLLELPPRPCQQRSEGILSVWPWSVPEFLQKLSDAAIFPSIGTVRQCIQMFASHWTLQSSMRLAGRGVPSTAINTEFMVVY